MQPTTSTSPQTSTVQPSAPPVINVNIPPKSGWEYGIPALVTVFVGLLAYLGVRHTIAAHHRRMIIEQVEKRESIKHADLLKGYADFLTTLFDWREAMAMKSSAAEHLAELAGTIGPGVVPSQKLIDQMEAMSKREEDEWVRASTYANKLGAIRSRLLLLDANVVRLNRLQAMFPAIGEVTKGDLPSEKADDLVDCDGFIAGTSGQEKG